MTNMKIDDKTSHNSPSLRFPEFTGEWERCVLGDVLEFSNTRINSSELNSGNYVSTENILQNFQGIVKARSIPEDTNVMAFSCGNILLSNIRPYLKKVWKATFNGGCSSDVFVLQANSNIDADYLHYVVANDKFIGFVMNGAKGVKMPRGDKNQMKTYSLSLPSIKEQRKISRFLSFLDERIAVQSRLIDRLQSLMIGIRHRIINEAKGKIVCLCEVSDIYQPQTISSADLTETGYPVYGANGIIGHYTSYNHEAEQVCITCRGNTCGGVNYTKSKSWITGNAMVVNVDRYQNIVSKRYLYHYLSNCDFNSIISGSGQPQIVRAPLAKFKIILPTVMQQYKIAHCLDVIQNKINVNSNILNLLIRQKQYLLRKMFI